MNQRYWARYFLSEFVPQLNAIIDTLESRVLPSFENIEDESDKLAEKTWNDIMSRPSTGDEDPGDFAEVAEQAGVSHYLLMDGIRQGVINLFAAALFHAFEQQVILFLRKEVLSTAEEDDAKLFNLREFQTRLKLIDVDVAAFKSWPKIDELRLLANVVKHAEGDSARKIFALRPDLFENPALEMSGIGCFGNVQLFQPLVGEDLYVSASTLREYLEHLLLFWRTELPNALRSA